MNLARVMRFGLSSFNFKACQQQVAAARVSRGILNLCKFSTTVSNRSLDISGIYPPLSTPFNQDESIAFDKMEENMKRWNAIPFRGYVVQGSNGECCFLSWQERLSVVRVVKKLAAPGKLIIAGSGMESTRDTIQMTNDVAKEGADAVLVVNPHYFKASMNAQALTKHFTKVADASPVPVILYNVPSNTGMDIPEGVIIELAKHPNVVGLKESGGDITRISSILHQTSGEDFQVLAGSAGFLLAAFNAGCVGAICGLANVAGEELCHLEQLANSGDKKAATEFQLRLVAPNTMVTRGFGVPAMKAAMDLRNYYGGPTRSPLQSLTDSEQKMLRNVFSQAGLL